MHGEIPREQYEELKDQRMVVCPECKHSYSFEEQYCPFCDE